MADRRKGSTNELLAAGGLELVVPAPIPTIVKDRNRVLWYIEPRTLGVMTKQGGNPLVIRPVLESGPGVLTEAARCGSPWRTNTFPVPVRISRRRLATDFERCGRG